MGNPISIELFVSRCGVRRVLFRAAWSSRYRSRATSESQAVGAGSYERARSSLRRSHAAAPLLAFFTVAAWYRTHVEVADHSRVGGFPGIVVCDPLSLILLPAWVFNRFRVCGPWCGAPLLFVASGTVQQLYAGA